MHWIIVASALLRLRRLPGARERVRALLDRPATIVIVGRRPPVFLRRWKVREALDVTDPVPYCNRPFPDLPPRVGFVLLDLERWPLTPTRVRLHPVRYASCVARSLRGRGAEVLAAPAADLMLGRPWRRLPGNIYTRYLASGLAPALARVSGIYEIQSQGLEERPARFARTVRLLVRAIRAVRPRIPVYAGLSTNPRGPRVPLRVLEEDIRRTRRFVTGYWLNVPAPGRACPRCRPPRPALALRLLEAEEARARRE